MADQKFAELDSLKLAYYDFEPVGDKAGTIVLVHGFASSAQMNWISTSWVKTLQNIGYRVIAMDNRGHGQSTKFYLPEEYGPDIFANDTFQLMDFLQIDRCDLMGYSMGSRIASWMAAQQPQRFKKVIFGGMGSHIVGGRTDYSGIIDALKADNIEDITDADALKYRKFAEVTGSDRLALAACIHPSNHKITKQMLGGIQTPVLVAVGSEDDVAGSPDELAAIIPNATAFTIEGMDHMKATGAQAYKDAVVEYLGD